MAEEFKCSNEQLHEYQFQAIQDTQKGILETQEQFDTRIKALELASIENRLEFANLKQAQSDQKALILDLDRMTNIKLQAQFSEVLASQSKMEIRTESQFEKASTAQEKNENKTEIKFNKIIEAQEKMEEKNNIRFQNIENGQNLILTQIIESQNVRETGKIEISKSKLVLWGTVFTGVVSVILFFLEKILPLLLL